MCLSRKSGSGKSHVIKSIIAFLRIFCKTFDVPFDIDIVKVTAYTGVVVAQFKIPGATTIHRAANLKFQKSKETNF